jgi:hypothetical protein
VLDALYGLAQGGAQCEPVTRSAPFVRKPSLVDHF